MKYLRIIISIFLFCIAFNVVLSQDGESQAISYGETIEGILPADEPDVEFIFQGVAGTILVAEVTNEDVLNGLQPQLAILNERGSTLATTSDINDGLENFNVFTSILAFEVPADEQYSIIVSDGPFGGAAGNNAEFVLRLLQPLELTEAEEVSEDADNQQNNYYTIISNDPFTLKYEFLSGDFYPAINIDSINDGQLQRLATMYGENLSRGTLTVTPNRNSLHLVTITSSAFDYDMFSRHTTTYQIGLIQD